MLVARTGRTKNARGGHPHAEQRRYTARTCEIVSRAKGRVMVSVGGGIGANPLYSHGPTANSSGTHLGSTAQPRVTSAPLRFAYAGPTWSEVGENVVSPVVTSRPRYGQHGRARRPNGPEPRLFGLTIDPQGALHAQTRLDTGRMGPTGWVQRRVRGIGRARMGLAVASR